MISNGIVSVGNTKRLREFIKRARNNEALTIGFLGGSITQGSAASIHKNCYAYRTFAWMKQEYQNENLHYVNAGIGGTTSQFGVARCQSDLLDKAPDFILVEFAVNDPDEKAFFEETYEGLLRTLIGYSTKIAIIAMMNVRYDDGGNAQSYHIPIAKHYELPIVSMKSSIYAHIEDGTIKREELTADMLHPNDKGHELISKEICSLLLEIENQTKEMEGNNQLPQPLTANRFEKSYRHHQESASPILKGFVEDHAKKESWDHFKKGYEASKVGDSLVIEAECSYIAVQYRKTIDKPAPIAMVVIDDQEENAIILDANFEETWGDSLALDTIATDLPYKKHKIEITINEVSKENKKPFYLLSIITA